MPSNNVKRRMWLCVLEPFATESGKNGPVCLAILIPRLGHLEVTFICETVCADWAQVRNHKVSLEDLANPAARLASIDINAELYSARDNTDFFLSHCKSTEFGRDQKRSILRHNQHVAVRVVESMSLVAHVLPATVVVNCQAVFQLGRTCAHHSTDTTNKVAVQIVLRCPSTLSRAHLHVLIPVKLSVVVEVTLLGRELLKVAPFSVLHSWLDAVSPRSLVFRL